MTPKEKSEDLFRDFYLKISGIPKDKTIFYNVEDRYIILSLNCAVFTVDQIRDAFYTSESEEKLYEDLIYWNNVKVELLKLY